MDFKRFLEFSVLSCLIVSLLFSCNQSHYPVPLAVEKALSLAGGNTAELEKVLNRYNNKKDSLKFSAACYLIENMPLHQATYHKNSTRINFVLKGVGVYDNADKKRAVWDSLAPYLSAVKTSELEIKKDIEIVGFDFLVENIDLAFYVWENYPWCKDISFEDFKRYLLPYRSSNEPLTFFRKKFMDQFSWLLDSMNSETDRVKAFAFIYNDFESWFKHTIGVKYPIPMDFEQLMLAKGGTCDDECNMLNAIMKSMGIVSVIDNIAYWANRSSGHSWVAALDYKNRPLIMDKHTNYPEQREYLHSGFWPLNPPADSLIPSYMYVTKEKKAAKILRRTILPNSEILKFNDAEIITPKEFQNPFMEDVTNQYITTADITAKISLVDPEEIVYLCLFDKNMLLPVDRAISKKNQCSFNNVGNEILYVVCKIQDGNFLPVSDPFIVNTDESLSYLSPSQKTQTMTLHRKYPLFGNILNYSNDLYGGKFQGSNDLEFTKASDLYCIENTPLNITEIAIKNNSSFRYVRYLPPINSYGDISELSFFNGMRKLDGQVISKYSGIGARNSGKAFDSDNTSYYRSDSTGTWIGLDLGSGNNSKITKIKFCPRTDTNFIIPGNKYGLYFWDKGWKLYKNLTALGQHLVFTGVPKGTLYWLKCLNGGKEERPFTYSNDMQIWW